MEKFTQDSLKRLVFVSQTGGTNVKIKKVWSGYESFGFSAVMFGQMPLTEKGVVRVFDIETEKWLGDIVRNHYGSPTRVMADEDLEFKDFYTVTIKEAFPSK